MISPPHCLFRRLVPFSVVELIVIFFFKPPATTEIYTLSLHDALPIFRSPGGIPRVPVGFDDRLLSRSLHVLDRKSTRLNSSHTVTSYAVFCLKKKKQREGEIAPDICVILLSQENGNDCDQSDAR